MARPHDGDAVTPWSQTELCCRGLVGNAPARTPGNEGQAFSVARAGWWKAGRDQKSPLRRCFKSRPPLRAGCAGSPPAASHGCKGVVRPSTASLERDAGRSLLPSTFRLVRRLVSDRDFKLEATLGSSTPWRLSGLLSGYLPTDTRPQARAKLGKNANKLFELAPQEFF